MARVQPSIRRTCNACGHEGSDLVEILLDNFSDSPAWVCPDPTLCRRRAIARGVYGGRVDA